MANVKISDLKNPQGSKLFSDPESYISELSELELDTLNINGGFCEYTVNTIASPSVVVSCEIIMPSQSIDITAR